MIAIDGVTGKGSVWATWYADTAAVSDYSLYTKDKHLNYLMQPTEWYLPPPDGFWRPVDKSPYGPRLARFEIGFITDDDKNEFNPCQHSTINGSAIYRGTNSDTNAPYFRSYCATSKSKYFTLDGKPVYAMLGRASTLSTDPVAYDRKGGLVRIPLGTGNQIQWASTNCLPLTIAPDRFQSLLPSGSEARSLGVWYGYNTSSGGIPDDYMSRYFYTEFSRVSADKFIRYQEREYHTTQSYVPYASISHASHSTGRGHLAVGEVYTDTITVTHVRSTRAGMFEIMYDIESVLSWEGWLPYKWLDGERTFIKYENVASLIVLAPGLTAACDPALAQAHDYCQRASVFAGTLHSPKQAEAARTAAVRDVQELDSNWIENLAGVKGTLDVLGPLFHGYRAVKSGNLQEARKALAGAYLAYKYVISPALNDYRDLKTHGVSTLQSATKNRFSNERRRGRVKETVPALRDSAQLTYTCTYHLKLKDNLFSEIWNALDKINLEPTASNLWDLIPFSFVVDWFLPIGRTLSTLDSYNNMSINRDLKAKIEGYKVQWQLNEDDVLSLFSGTLCSNGKPLEYIWYDRRISDRFGSIDPLAGSVRDGLSCDQMVQGAALLTQYF